MAIVKGEIESLKRLKSTLKEKGIYRFNSIADINDFLINFEREKAQYVEPIKEILENEISETSYYAFELKRDYEKMINKKLRALQGRSDFYDEKYINYKKKKSLEFLARVDRIVYLMFFKCLLLLLSIGIRVAPRVVGFQTKRKYKITKKRLDYLTSNRQEIVLKRGSKKLIELYRTKDVIDELYPLVAGAIGERLVERELSKLPDSYFLYNDFSVKFKNPVYYKDEKKRIFSIQIDHLVVSNAGIFVLETKNWSKKSIESLQLKSPVSQIKRASYGMYHQLNHVKKSITIGLKKHAWGKKEIPIRNIIVMIHGKPQEKFQFVQIKMLQELNKYISFFEPIFSDAEVLKITNHLDGMRQAS